MDFVCQHTCQSRFQIHVQLLHTGLQACQLLLLDGELMLQTCQLLQQTCLLLLCHQLLSVQLCCRPVTNMPALRST